MYIWQKAWFKSNFHPTFEKPCESNSPTCCTCLVTCCNKAQQCRNHCTCTTRLYWNFFKFRVSVHNMSCRCALTRNPFTRWLYRGEHSAFTSMKLLKGQPSGTWRYMGRITTGCWEFATTSKQSIHVIVEYFGQNLIDISLVGDWVEWAKRVIHVSLAWLQKASIITCWQSNIHFSQPTLSRENRFDLMMGRLTCVTPTSEKLLVLNTVCGDAGTWAAERILY